MEPTKGSLKRTVVKRAPLARFRSNLSSRVYGSLNSRPWSEIIRLAFASISPLSSTVLSSVV